MSYPIRHLPNPPKGPNWPLITISIYAASGFAFFGLIAIAFLIFR